MSNKRNKAQRKKQGVNLKDQRKAKGGQKPQVDPRRQRANVAQLNQVLNIALQQVQQLEKKTQDSVKQLWDNQSSVKTGMDSAEFNLRAQQKVINAMAIEIEHMAGMFNELITSLHSNLQAEDVQKIGFGAELHMTSITVPPEEGREEKELRRVDWPFYHAQVEKDLEVLAEYEREVQEAQQAKARAVTKAVDKLRETCTKESLEDLAKRIEDGEQILKDYDDGREFELDEEYAKAVATRLRLGPIDVEALQKEQAAKYQEQLDAVVESARKAGIEDAAEVEDAARELFEQMQKVSEELGKMVAGEPYNEEVILEAQALIELMEREEAKEGAPQIEEPPQEGEFPEGAAIFGDDDGIQESGPGDQGAESPDRSEEDGTPGDVQEDAVPGV
jgi:hypothetical protein